MVGSLSEKPTETSEYNIIIDNNVNHSDTSAEAANDWTICNPDKTSVYNLKIFTYKQSGVDVCHNSFFY